MPSHLPRRPRVALLVETSRAYGRELLIGIAQYVRIHGPWSIAFEENADGDPLPAWFRRWRWDGVIARVKTPSLVRTLRRCGAPVVDLGGSVAPTPFPYLRSDEDAVGRLAAEHLLARGFRRFAFCGFQGADWSELRGRGFVRRLAAAGFACTVYTPPEPERLQHPRQLEELGEKNERALRRWLLSLERPVGLMVVNDVRGRQVLDSCCALQIAVPDDLAVIGVDNDEIFCGLADLPLTSVILDGQQIGREAAALLDRLMRGGRAAAGPILIPPRGVATRRSTDVLAIEDRQVAAALHLIRDRACEGLDVPALAQAVSLSRRVLERRFAQILGRSPNEEILRVRLERVRGLLTESDLSLAAVAEKAGFGYAEYLSRLFKQRFGLTPGQYRRRAAPARSSALAPASDPAFRRAPESRFMRGAKV